ncbi:MAG: hypothetical protein KF767_01135 [Bdellovibrionaceae bacterium]|nr:hypothetical protein [Pseudobdellovibrionaceae bacterium]
MLLLLNLAIVQAAFLNPFGSGDLNWNLWKHYSPATSSLVLCGVFLGQMILTQAWPKAVRVLLFTAFVTAMAALGPWVQRAFDVRGSGAASVAFFQQTIEAVGSNRFWMLVAGIAVMTFLRSLRFR